MLLCVSITHFINPKTQTILTFLLLSQGLCWFGWLFHDLWTLLYLLWLLLLLLPLIILVIQWGWTLTMWCWHHRSRRTSCTTSGSSQRWSRIGTVLSDGRFSCLLLSSWLFSRSSIWWRWVWSYHGRRRRRWLTFRTTLFF